MRGQCCLLSLALHLVGGLVLQPMGKPNLSAAEAPCQAAVDRWLTDLRPVANASSATLHVDWALLDADLDKTGCTFSAVVLQLYRLNPQAKDKLAKADYFQQHDAVRCLWLDTDVLSFHSELSHFGGQREEGEQKHVFEHVFDESYILRACMCSLSVSAETCNCISPDTKPRCGPPINVKSVAVADSSAFDWCPREKTFSSEKAVLRVTTTAAPIVDCTSVRLSLSLASCLPLQSYDRIRVDFFAADVSDASDDGACADPRHYSHRARSATAAERVRPSNRTHSTFEVTIEHLLPNTTYCYSLELTEHPYCNTNTEILVNQPEEWVCSSHFVKPIRTKSSSECSMTPSLSSLSDAAPHTVLQKALLACALVLVATVAAAGTALFFVRRMRQKRMSPAVSLCSPPEQPMPHARATDGHSVYLAVFPESEEFVDLADKFKAWLEALGQEVIEPSDEKYVEDVLPNPEAWLASTLERSDVRVILVNSPYACKVAANRGTPQEEKEPLLMAHDNLRALRVQALRHLTTRFAGDYKKVLVVSYLQPPQPDPLSTLVTPGRQCLLQHHLDVVRDWVLGGTIPNGKQESEAEAATKRLQRRLNELAVNRDCA